MIVVEEQSFLQSGMLAAHGSSAKENTKTRIFLYIEIAINKLQLLTGLNPKIKNRSYVKREVNSIFTVDLWLATLVRWLVKKINIEERRKTYVFKPELNVSVHEEQYCMDLEDSEMDTKKLRNDALPSFPVVMNCC